MRVLNKDIWPCRVKVDIESNDFKGITEMEVWLGETLGTFRDRWTVVHHYKYAYFYFHNENDAVLFSLRWT